MKKPVCCWYKREACEEWKCGFFHRWSQSYEEFECGLGHFPAAIIEDAVDCECHVVYAGHVSFSPDDPNPKPKISKEQIDKLVGDGLGTRFEPRLYAVGNHRLMIAHPDCGEVFVNNQFRKINETTLPFTWLCQVRWKVGKLECNQGGLPIREFTRIFNEVRGA